MKLKYPLIIVFVFMLAVVSNNQISEWKTYRFYSEMKNIDDPIREELKKNDFLCDEADNSTMVINLWATWCGPCQKEIPHLNELMGKYDDGNTLFLSVTDESEKEVNEWISLQKNEPEYFQMYENKRLINYLFQLNPKPGIKKGQAPELLPTNIIIHDGKLLLFEQGFSDENIAKMDSVLMTLRGSEN